ncbi:hypothetical protein TIFTF001_050523 [Ficus carica]|uniref:DUF7847 domain-containing protein n=1 Tax=Ficus carica TaxID=3494 RepID=A0AA88CS90_FICCA|nr:hypothetical protein TIFTF001_050518 [Ficus carica]GMN28233.1 hypothetical protein TIFTF001_050523 [Ficus carica]
MATPEPLKLRKVLSESYKIIKAQPQNFSALTFLFLTPPTIAALLYPTLQSLFKETNDQPANTPYKTLINLLALALYVFNIVFSICAIGSISYTAFRGFSGEVIELKSAIKSLSSSFFPLLGTTLLVQIIVFIIAFILSILAISGYLLVSGGFRIELFSSPLFVGFVIALMVVMVLLVFYLQVNWSLAYVVVVVESAWGFKALKRSKALIKGNRGLALSLCLIFAVLYVYWMWISNMSPYIYIYFRTSGEVCVSGSESF